MDKELHNELHAEDLFKTSIHIKNLFFILVEKTKEYVLKNNINTMVLGISGGIDSTVCAAICSSVEQKTENKVRFIGVSLPCSTNSTEENDSAKACLEAFCKPENRIYHNLEKEYEMIHDSFAEDMKNNEIGQVETAISNGNIKARLRMMYLYNIASISKGIVIDTDNLTEHNLGFWTLHGDVGDFNPIGGLWKSEIYDLAKHLKNYTFKWEIEDADGKKKLALKHAIDITPTDGNGVADGGDMAQIAPGLKYKNVDEILQTVTCQADSETMNEMIELFKKYGNNAIKVMERYKNSEFKRKHLPVVIDRSFICNKLNNLHELY